VKNNFPEELDSKFKKKYIQKKGVYISSNINDFDEKAVYNFSLQWEKFQKTQFDSYTNQPTTFNRLFKNTKWKEKDLKGKKFLEVGSGAGRFTEILKKMGCKVSSVDLSDAIFVNAKNNKSKNINFYKTSIYDMPFKKKYFDYIFCYGVLQHLPDGNKAFAELLSFLKKNGRLSIDWYKVYFYPWSSVTTKYLYRPITKRMNPNLLFKFLEWFIPKWLPVDTFIKKLPAGRNLAGLIPICCYNYFYMKIPEDQKIQWAIMNTFDALGAKYDIPKTFFGMKKLVKSLKKIEYEIFAGSNGWVLNLKRK
tara:strand:- start:177 stop:1097 length:921 start_codon:yes stop_codon:yes gene_type:complete